MSMVKLTINGIPVEVPAGSTVLEAAREAGVTRSLVSYVICGNTDRSVAPETRQRILDAIEKLGYRPNKAEYNALSLVVQIFNPKTRIAI